MIGEYLKRLERIEKEYRDKGEYDKADEVNEIECFLWETWYELLRLTVTRA